MKKRSVLSLVCLLVILLPLLSAPATPEAPREFSPVQKGFVTEGEKFLPYAPDRIMVKFTEYSLENPGLQVDSRRGALVAGAETGIPSVDALSRDVGVVKISRAYIEPGNTEEAVRLGIDRWFMVEVPRGTDIPDVVARYAADPNVEYARPDWRLFPAAVPTDPLYPDHWGHNNTAQLPGYDWGGTWDHTGPPVGTPGFDANAQNAWDAGQGYGSSSIIIAIIDTGVDIDHPDLSLVAGYDFGDNDSNPDDNSAAAGHGTCCAGVAASLANNGRGACGAAPGCRVMPLKIANSAGSMYFSAMENALYWAADHGADVISMSLGAYVSNDPATDAALSYAYNAGCVILAATSNDNYSYISYPANHSYVIGVGAASPCGDRKRSSSNTSELNPGVNPDPNGYTCDGERWWGSNYGTNSQDAAGAVDILGPTIVPTTDIAGSGGYRSGDYEPFFNGTSCATPYVAGVCGLIKSANPAWTPAQIRNQLVTTAIDIVNVESGSGWDRYSGYGMVDAEAAVGGGGPTPPTAAFVGSPTSGDAPLSVDFTDQSTGNPTSWSWNFGDMGTSSSQNPSHTYTGVGTYTVTLTVSNAYGSDDEVKTNYITVTEPGSGYANLPYSTGFESGSLDQYWTTLTTNEGRIRILTTNTPHSGSYHMCMDDAVNGGNYSQCEAWLHLNLAGKSDVELDFWWKDFGDETHSQDGVYFSNNSGSSFTKVYNLNGGSYTNNVWNNFVLDVDALAASVGLSLTSTFVIKFQQYDNYAMTTDGMAFDDISVTAQAAVPPVAAFSGSPTSGTAPLQVQFTDESTGDPTSWFWDFGDDGTSTVQNPSHTYTDAGTYTVSLTVSNAVGSDDEVKTNYISVSLPPPPVAAFVGDPTSGAVPLTVDFTDQSTGVVDTWSWNFGDGVGTSSVQNPTYQYTSVGNYTVTLTVTGPGGSDDEVKTNYITVTEGGDWVVITYDDFEGGWGSYTDGGGDCARYTGGTRAHQGSCAANIQDNSGTASSFYHTAGHNVSGYTTLEVEFWFYAYSMESGEDFWVQYYDGSAWRTVASYARGTDFNNNVFYNKVVTFSSGQYNFPTNARLRFMCDASGDYDDVYIDEIEFRGISGGGSSGDIDVADEGSEAPEQFALRQNYPNPFNPVTTIRFSLVEEGHTRVEIYNVAGQRVATLVDHVMPAGNHEIPWNAAGKASGVYFCRLTQGTRSVINKMVLLR